MLIMGDGWMNEQVNEHVNGLVSESVVGYRSE